MVMVCAAGRIAEAVFVYRDGGRAVRSDLFRQNKKADPQRSVLFYYFIYAGGFYPEDVFQPEYLSFCSAGLYGGVGGDCIFMLGAAAAKIKLEK